MNVSHLLVHVSASRPATITCKLRCLPFHYSRVACSQQTSEFRRNAPKPDVILHPTMSRTYVSLYYGRVGWLERFVHLCQPTVCTDHFICLYTPCWESISC